ncbi:MAG: quinone-dependent dihydroorotate dehydrogenase [Minisyncoccia bacterium]
MNETAVRYRNKIIHGSYSNVLKPIFFRFDPEAVHDGMTSVGKNLGALAFSRALTGFLFNYENPVLTQEILGITFKNPVGLAAGFDKNAQLVDILPDVGFGFAEVGSITGEKCAGNAGTRLWRLPKSKSLAVYYGLKNDGCEAISMRLTGKKFRIPIGASVAMTNCAENNDTDKAIKDYAKAFKTMEPIADYITVNISCPNTQGGQPFIAPAELDKLFTLLDTLPTKKPIFIKLSPDITHEQIDAILAVLSKHRVHGIICSNLTKKKDNPKLVDAGVLWKGGISGKGVEDASNALLAYAYKKAGSRFVLIGCGGVFTAEDAYKKIRLGASLIQMIAGMIYEGPQVISEINQGLSELLRRDGFKNISDAIGVDNR